MSRIYLLLIILQVIFFRNLNAEECETKDVKKTIKEKIKNELLCNYDKDEHAVQPDSNVTTVWMKSRLADVKFSFFGGAQFEVRYSLQWRDLRLSWDPDKFQNVHNVTLHSSLVWTPRIVGLSSPSEYSPLETTKCVLNSTGDIKCEAKYQEFFDCYTDLTYWPFNLQRCTGRLGYNQDLDIQIEGSMVYKSDLFDRKEYRIIEIGFQKNSGFFTYDNVQLSNIEYSFVFERYLTVDNYIFTIVPQLVFIATSVITMCLDPKNVYRLYISYFNINLHLFFLQHFFWKIKFIANMSDCPKVITFVRDSLIITITTLVITVFLKHVAEKKMAAPRWLITLLTYILQIRVVELLLEEHLNKQKEIEDPNPESEAAAGHVLLASNKLHNKEWNLFANLLNMVFIIIIITVYVILFIPLYSQKAKIEIVM